MCAWVKADDETGAKHEVNKDWPEAEDWRFCDDKELPTVEKMKEHGRFVPPDWSETRISAEHGGNA